MTTPMNQNTETFFGDRAFFPTAVDECEIYFLATTERFQNELRAIYGPISLKNLEEMAKAFYPKTKTEIRMFLELVYCYHKEFRTQNSSMVCKSLIYMLLKDGVTYDFKKGLEEDTITLHHEDGPSKSYTFYLSELIKDDDNYIISRPEGVLKPLRVILDHLKGILLYGIKQNLNKAKKKPTSAEAALV